MRLLRGRDDYLRTYVAAALEAESTIDISVSYLFHDDPASRYILLDLLPYVAMRGVRIRVLLRSSLSSCKVPCSEAASSVDDRAEHELEQRMASLVLQLQLQTQGCHGRFRRQKLLFSVFSIIFLEQQRPRLSLRMMAIIVRRTPVSTKSTKAKKASANSRLSSWEKPRY